MGSNQSDVKNLGSNSMKKSILENQCKDKQSKIVKNGKFNKDKFGLELKQFLSNQFDGLTIQGSELHARLFKIFDESNDDDISQEEFLKGMKKLVLDKESRAGIMFRILDKYNNKTISKPEFDDYIVRSYNKGTKLLKKLMQGKKIDTDQEAIDKWSESSSKEFVDMMSKDFFRWSENKQYLSKDDVEKMCKEFQDLVFEQGDVKVQVPLCLYNWEFNLMSF